MQKTSLAIYIQTQRDLYVAELPEKIAALATALQQFSRTGEPNAALSALAQAHKLAGSGGTFGFPAVSEAAMAIEKILSGHAATLPPLDAAARRSLEAGLKPPTTALQQAGRNAAIAPPARAVKAAGEVEPPLPAYSTRRVHIIEPDRQAAVQLAVQLDRAGYDCEVVVQPGSLALGDRPAAILANPVFSADPALHRMAEPTPEGLNAVPVIFISGGSAFPDRLEAIRAGGVGYFPDPLDTRALTTLLDHVTSEAPMRPYRILIVDDDEALANFYAGVLQSVGMETCVVTDPGQVMGPLVGFRPDLITCDIHMPHCSGIELAAVIRQQAEFVRIPIMFLSAETSADQQALALKQGGDGFILKPVEPATLITAAQSRARRYRSLLAAEDTLRISEERFRLVFETSLDGFIQSLADGTVISANQAACAMFRMNEQQIRAAGVIGLMDPGDTRMAGVFRDKSRTGEFRGELYCVRGDGTRFPVEFSSSRHFNRSGDMQVSVILRDITERKLADQKIMQLNAELESRVEQRTAELTAANQELQAFSHSLAHDLRQPYIAINGLTTLLEKEVATGASDLGKHYLQRIRAGVSQMNQRTDSLLALAQLSRAHIRREQVDLADMAEQILAALQQQDPRRILYTHIQKPLVAHADAGLLLLLLNILLGNAWKFGSQQVSTDITMGTENGTDGETLFFVKDNGAGFDMAYVDKLFTAFQRLHSPGEFSGAGIGLAMARRIVDRHGGKIWADAMPGEGAQFYFTLGQPTR